MAIVADTKLLLYTFYCLSQLFDYGDCVTSMKLKTVIVIN